MTTFRLKRFSVYDDTDNLKRMKDSDILSEKKRESIGTKNIVGGAITGGAILGSGGALGNALLRRKGKYFKGMGKRFLKGGKYGAIAGVAAGVGSGLLVKSQQDKKNAFYNNRLAYAQEQARRRERKDWKNNMTNREGYSY